MAHTTTDLLRSIKVKGQIPTSQNTFSTADMLGLADDETRTGLVPMLMSVRESYFQTYKDVAIVDGTAAYAVPTRAIGEKLKEVQLVDTAGNVRDLDRIEKEDVHSYSQGSSSALEGFYFEGSDIVLVPTPTGLSDHYLRLTYFKRPSSLVAITAAGQITAINTGTREVTISSTPSTFTTSRTYDFIQANPGFKNLSIDQAVSSVASNILTFSSALPSGLAIGDWVALAGETPIPQLPVEFHSVLALRTAISILRALGHEKEADSKQKELEKLEERVLGLVSPRVEGEPKKVISRTGVLNPNGFAHPFFRS